MNSDLSATRCLQLLRQLKASTLDAAHAEEQLHTDIRNKRFQVERTYQQAVKVIDDKLAADETESAAYFAALVEQVQHSHDTRAKRIQRFMHAGTRDLAHMSQGARERYLGALQAKRMTLERERKRQLQAARIDAEERIAKLSAQQDPIASLERAAKSYLGGYARFLRLLVEERGKASVPSKEAEQAIASIAEHCSQVRTDLAKFKSLTIPRLFSLLPLLAIIIVATAIGTSIAFALASPQSFSMTAAVSIAVLLVLVYLLHFIGWHQGKQLASVIAVHLAQARKLLQTSTEAAEAEREKSITAIAASFEGDASRMESAWNKADTVQEKYELAIKEKIATRAPDLLEKNAMLLSSKFRYITLQSETQRDSHTTEADAKRGTHIAARDKSTAELAAEEASRFAIIEARFKTETTTASTELRALIDSPATNFPAWTKALVTAWEPTKVFSSATRFGSIALDLTSAQAKDQRLALPCDPKLVAPVALGYPQAGSILIETNTASDLSASGTISNMMQRLLVTTPPGKVAFTIFDPVGLGQNFAGIMHLGDYEETLINRRIWTQRDQIEERLAELNDHIEKVIQMYLRNEYETITQYNAEAGSVAEKYHFLVVADFPANFSDVAAKRLQSIAVSGPRCGVFTLIHWDKRAPLPDGFVPDELRKSSICLKQTSTGFQIEGAPEGATLTLDAPASDEIAVELLHKIGKASIDSNRIQVPFTQIAPKPDAMWSESTTNELRVPIGRTGATKLQYLSIGKGTRQHALFAGKTGSGKSTLFHVIITNLALYCSPDEVEFYLIDFKKGVEFKCYAEHKLPHARVIAIESDREFGLSVLQRVDEELKRRGDMFRKLGVQDIAGYKRAGGKEPVPRTLLLIDEFQEFFTEDDTVSQNASVLFDRVVRQGRAFGIHVLLGSQTLGGAFTLAKATMGQMVIRVALQCNEADAHLIMDDNNSAPRLLTRPGEGIYNDAAGALEGNSPFQVCWLADEERDQWLERANELAKQRGVSRPGPIVFEGNAPADIRENYALAQTLASKPRQAPTSPRIWLGAPNSIKGPTEAVFHRQAGNHLLIVGQREEVTLGMMGLGLISLAAQYPAGSAKIYFLHSSLPGTPDERYIQSILAALPNGAVTAVQPHELADTMNSIGEDLKSRLSGDQSTAQPVFLFIHGLHKFKKLKADDDMDFSFGSSSDSGESPSKQLTTILTEGSTQGIHLVVTVDTYNNVTRFLSRKLLSEIEMRVVLQMSANDSASLIDSPKAADLGLHRALLHNEQAGTLETFRPYAEPDTEWLEEVQGKLLSSKR
jgi:hypothetical protein